MRQLPLSKLLFQTLVASLTLIMLFTGACDTIDEPQGRIKVLLTDAPIDDILEANVTIERVEILDSTGKSTVLSEEIQDFDLLKLRDGVTANLADISVDNATFNQIRVVVSEDASVLLSDMTVETLKIPSGSTSGIKIIKLPAISIGDGIEQAIITLDFDAEQSFVKAGNSGKYIFKPVIKPLSISIDGVSVAPDTTSSDTTTTG